MVNRSWGEVKSTFHAGDIVVATIIDRKPFGLLVELEDRIKGVIERIGLANAGYDLDALPVGSRIEATILGLRDWSEQVELCVKKKISKG